MNTVKLIYHQLKAYLGNFTKRPKKKGKPKLAIANQKNSQSCRSIRIGFYFACGATRRHSCDDNV